MSGREKLLAAGLEALDRSLPAIASAARSAIRRPVRLNGAGPSGVLTSRLWVAKLETTNFRFEAYGRTYEEALEALRRGWNWHRRQTGATLRWAALVDGGDVHAYEVAIGRAYRDGSPI